jgi:hypothetical protein
MPTGAELSHYDWYTLYAERAAGVIARKVEPLLARRPKGTTSGRTTLQHALVVAVVGAKEQWPDPAAVLDHAGRFDPLTADYRRLDLTPAQAETLAGLARAAAAEGKRR